MSAVMQPAYDPEQLDDILSRWHSWAQGEHVTQGHANRSLVVGDVPEKRGLQYESQLEAQHALAEARQCRQVDFAVRQMDDPYRAAIYCDARNIVYGIAVWTSPRLPADRAEREIVVGAARAMLAGRLMRDGVM